ncbi:MAG: 2-dehydropantoate 2-reductase [Verrucomicrobia bacterium]|nr:2-dehydropantoate 2-reductase [Verrucomicrobiota bacterium]
MHRKDIDPLRIGIVGSGALGGQFGIRFAHAGLDVHFLLRSDYAIVQEKGFTLEFTDADPMHLKTPNIYRDAGKMGIMDVVLIAMKTTANDHLPELLEPLVDANTVLFTVQNGLGNVEFLQQHFPGNQVVAGLAQIGVNRVAPGHIRSFVPGGGFVLVGEPDGVDSSYGDLITTLLERGKVTTKRAPSLGEALWRKLMWNVPYNGLTIVAGCVGTDVIVSNPALNEYSKALMLELQTASCALGYPIEAEYADKLIGFTKKLGEYLPSSLLDFKAGRAVEVEAIFGEPLRRGIKAGVKMPHLQSLYWLLKGLHR